MGIFRRIFGSNDSQSSSSSDADGFFMYVQCDNCGDRVRLRVHKQHDLNQVDEGYAWHKTIVDSRCFRPMVTVVHFDSNYRQLDSEIEGGRYITKEAYELAEVSQTTDSNRVDG